MLYRNEKGQFLKGFIPFNKGKIDPNKHKKRLEYLKKYYKKNIEKFREKRKLRKEYHSEYRKKNRIKIRFSIKNCRNEKRKKVLDFLGGKCVRCGFTDIRALQVDHIHGGGRTEIKKYNREYVLYLLKQIESSHDDFRKKYQLLCANCNWIKKSENNEIRKH